MPKSTEPQLLPSFTRSVSTLLSGSTIGLLVSYVAQILMVFFFTKDELGFADTFLAAATILATITSLRYEDAIPLPKSSRDAAQIFILANVLNLGINACLLGVVFWRTEIALWMHLPPLVDWLWMLPLMAALFNMTRILETWLTRQKDFKLISFNRMAQNTLGNVLQLLGGFLRMGLSGLMVGMFAGRFFSLAFLGRHLISKDGQLILQQFKRPLLVAKFKQYKDFGRYSMPAALLNTLPAQLVFLILQKYFAQGTVGEFGRGYKLLAIPAALLSSAVGQVFFLHASEAKRSGHLAETTLETARRIIAIGLLPTVVALLAAPTFFELILGEDWRTAGIFAQYLAPWIFFSTIASPLTRIFDVLQRQKWDLAFSIVMFIVQIGVLWVSLDQFDALYSVQCLAVSGIIMRLIQILLLYFLANVSLLMLPIQLLRYLLYALPCELLLLVANRTQNTGLIVFATLLGAGIYGLLFYEFEIRRAK